MSNWRELIATSRIVIVLINDTGIYVTNYIESMSPSKTKRNVFIRISFFLENKSDKSELTTKKAAKTGMALLICSNPY